MNDIALRVATAMQQMGIDGLPRNYELVYEAYAGISPDLVRDFVALGKYKSQAALDELGRKYLPHHHEAGLLQRSTGAVRDEMSNFMQLLDREKSALDDYGRIIGEASRVIAGADAGFDPTLGQSIQMLKQATERQVSHNAAMEESVGARSRAMAGIEEEMAAREAARFTDPLTGLANRRAFNKALARVYANADAPLPCGLVVAEIEAFGRFSTQQMATLADRVARHAGAVIRQVFATNDLAARFDGARFGFLFYTSDEAEVLRLVGLLRSALRMAPPGLVTDGDPRGLTLAAGLCMAESAATAFDLVAAGERALAAARQAGGDRVIVHAPEGQAVSGRDWMIYRAS